jgi:alkylated DNA nucleotide flippase Atl1
MNFLEGHTMKPKKSWREKLADSKDLPRVEVIPERMKTKWGEGTLVIPAPREVDELMQRVPKGKVTTINAIRVALARKHRATIACPITTGIFAWIAANAADEATALRPKARITPYWRTLKAGGVLNEKYPGGVANQEQRLIAEGHRVGKKGKHQVVTDLDQSLFDFGAGD